jgi:hypothetical protein
VSEVAEMTSVLAAAPVMVNSGNGHIKQARVIHYHMFISVPRSGDHALDIQRVSEVYELLQSYPGEDHFSIYTTNSAGRVLLDFPNASTKNSVQLQQKLTQILGAGTVKVKSVEEAA